MKRHTRERGCFSNSNISSSTVNSGIAFRWTTDIHILVQFLTQSGCDKMSANANSEYNLAAAQRAFRFSPTVSAKNVFPTSYRAGSCCSHRLNVLFLMWHCIHFMCNTSNIN